MAIFVVSDLHGALDELGDAVPKESTLLLLGDLINFVDYFSMTGILTEVFSVETVAEVVRLRTAGRLDDARRAMRKRSAGREDEIRAKIAHLVRAEYEALFEALDYSTYLILGNVDNPAVAHEFAEKNPAAQEVDGQVVVLEGERVGFIGGALPTPLRTAGEVSEAEMRAKVEALGVCDLLCSHIPPAVPELCLDTVAGKPERGSKDLLDYIRDVQPRYAYFGHIHQPLVSSMSIGATRCINVGYFRATRRAWLHVPEVDGR